MQGNASSGSGFVHHMYKRSTVLLTIASYVSLAIMVLFGSGTLSYSQSDQAFLDQAIQKACQKVADSLQPISDLGKIAIVPFMDDERNAVYETLLAEVLKSKKFDVIERRHLEYVMNEQKLTMAGIVDSDSAAELGKLSGADAIMFGTIRELGETVDGEVCKLQLRLVRVKDSSVLWADNIMAKVEIPEYKNRTWALECSFKFRAEKDMDGILKEFANGRFKGSYEFGSLTAKYSDVQEILFKEGPSCEREGIALTNGDFVSGTLQSYSGKKFVLKTSYGTLVVNKNQSVARICCVASGKEQTSLYDHMENPRAFTREGDVYTGELTSFQGLNWILKTRYGTVTLPQERMYGITYVRNNPISAATPYGIGMVNGDKVTGEIISYENGGFVVDTGYGQLDIDNAEMVAYIVFGGGSGSRVSEKDKGKAGAKGVWIDPQTGMEFVWVPGGCYDMGCGSWTSDCDGDEKPVHEVCVDGFWMGKTEVTQGQWSGIMGGNPSYFKKGDNYPVEMVSWNDVKEFIGKLNSRSSGGYTFRLPREAEWEYACRSGGKREKYSGGGDVDRVAWYFSNSGHSTHAVGTKVPNGLGLYDMSGNVWEWCEDWYDKDAYSKHRRDNPICDSGGSDRVLRAGRWGSKPRRVRCANRYGHAPDYRNPGLGFRLVKVAP